MPFILQLVQAGVQAGVPVAQVTRSCCRNSLFRSFATFGLTPSTPETSHNDATPSTTSNNLGATSPPKNPPALTKKDIIKKVASANDLTIKKAETIMKTILDSIIEGVAVEGKDVRLSGFGSFDSYMSKPRAGRNPRTNEPIEIPSKRRIRFKAYDSFKNSS